MANNIKAASVVHSQVIYIYIYTYITEAGLLAGHAGVSALARLQEAGSRGRFGGGGGRREWWTSPPGDQNDASLRALRLKKQHPNKYHKHITKSVAQRLLK